MLYWPTAMVKPVANLEPRMDFRYRDEAGVEIEAFQVTLASRWDAEHWPPWLQTQGSANELNKVYTDAADPKHLFISLESGRFAIEEDAYIVMEGGLLMVQAGDAFESQFSKVVPVPPRNLDKESLAGFERTHRMEDGKLVKLSQEEIDALPTVEKLEYEKPVLRELDMVPGAVDQSVSSNLRPKAEIAFEMMLEGDDAAGMRVLKNALADETDWCVCAPGQCVGGPRWGCRQNSPLVQS